jgi:hypothetical protein
MDTTHNIFAIALDAPLSYGHFASREYQAEVVLLSRRITFRGQESGDNFGGHTMV